MDTSARSFNKPHLSIGRTVVWRNSFIYTFQHKPLVSRIEQHGVGGAFGELGTFDIHGASVHLARGEFEDALPLFARDDNHVMCFIRFCKNRHKPMPSLHPNLPWGSNPGFSGEQSPSACAVYRLVWWHRR